MFILSITYKVPLETVEQYIDAHMAYLNGYYLSVHFVVSGRKVPRTGGIILAKGASLEEVMKIAHADPFYIHGVSDVEVTEFVAGRTIDELSFLKG